MPLPRYDLIAEDYLEPQGPSVDSPERPAENLPPGWELGTNPETGETVVVPSPSEDLERSLEEVARVFQEANDRRRNQLNQAMVDTLTYGCITTANEIRREELERLNQNAQNLDRTLYNNNLAQAMPNLSYGGSVTTNRTRLYATATVPSRRYGRLAAMESMRSAIWDEVYPADPEPAQTVTHVSEPPTLADTFLERYSSKHKEFTFEDFKGLFTDPNSLIGCDS